MKTNFLLKGEIKKKNQFNKRTKKKKTIKRIRTTLKKIIYHKLRLKDVIEKKKKFYKRVKNKNQKNKD
jgi:hypothetical protein